ncbi:fungal-specific transcription factor domain-containing protein, partial [Diplogelasinospora grovesii]
MADLRAYTHVFRADIKSASGQQQARVYKRTRNPVSCFSCRARKMKCDRQHPVCGACSKRGDDAACRYSTSSLPASTGAKTGVGNESAKEQKRMSSGDNITASSSAPPRQGVALRLQKLEEMVNGLITSSRQATATARCDSTGTGGHLSSSGTEVSFIGATHWEAILESIHDLQAYLEPDPDDGAEAGAEPDMGRTDNEEASQRGPDLVFGAVNIVTIRDVLDALPSRSEADALLSLYFSTRINSKAGPMLHQAQFRREYEAFWQDPHGTSLLWISMLFSVLAMGSIAYFLVEVRGSEGQLHPHYVRQPPQHSRWVQFKAKALQCLVAGDYLKAKPYSVEAILLYALTRVVEKKDLDPCLWSIFGVATRLAQRMGYHRDPAQLMIQPSQSSPRSEKKGQGQAITPFQAEMRRRVWFIVESFDLMYSLQLGMPTIIQSDQCDVQPPTNLSDDDFDFDCVELPPSKPDTEATPVLYYCHKSRVVRVLRSVMRHALQTPRRPGYDSRTMELHAEVVSVQDNIPPILRYRPISSYFTDSPQGPFKDFDTLFHRLALEIMHLKGLCVLHRPYLASHKEDPAYAFSRDTCRGAALRMLQLIIDLAYELRPGGRLHGVDKYFLSSLVVHDSLLAAMILCLDLNESRQHTQEDWACKLAALQRTHMVWTKLAHVSRDASHASKVLAAMLRKVTGASSTSAAVTSAIGGGCPNRGAGPSFSSSAGTAQAAATATPKQQGDYMGEW